MKKAAADRRGALMVFATFFAVLMAGLLYHVIGVGEATVENGLVQNSADSAVWSAATVKARCMNSIALINLIMATVLAVLVAIRLLMAVIGVIIAALGVACVVSAGAACGAATPLIALESKLHTLSKDLEEPIKQVLNGLSQAQDAIVKAEPVVRHAEALYVSRQEGGNTAYGAIVFPVLDPLPVERGEFSELCAKAAEQVVEVATFFLPGDLGQEANATIGKILGEMAGQFSGFFCGNSDKAPPDSFPVERPQPSSHDSACGEPDAWPVPPQYSCTTALCKRCSDLACQTCIAEMRKRRAFEGTWLVREEKWRAGDSRPLQPSTIKLTTMHGDPCMGNAQCGAESICTVEEIISEKGETRILKKHYVSIHGCIVPGQARNKSGNTAIDGGDWPRPMRLEADVDEERFRMRSIAMGRRDSDMRIARTTLRAENHSSSRRLAVAAAAFDSPHRDLWHMNWKSRLIRFRLPANGLSESSCSGGDGGCSAKLGWMRDVMQQAGDALIH